MKPIKIKIQVESIYKKDGIKNGKKWERYGLKAGGIYYNFFGAKWNEYLQNSEGKEVEFEYVEEEFKGKMSNNIVNPNSYDSRIKELEARVTKIEKHLNPEVEQEKTEDYKDEEIPF